MSWERQINVKTPAELKIMREAGRINALVLVAVKERLKPGVATTELNAAAEEVLKSHGCGIALQGMYDARRENVDSHGSPLEQDVPQVCLP